MTGKFDGRVCRQLDLFQIIEGYRLHFEIDIRAEFQDITSLYLCECPTTGAQFFSPKVEGSDSLYQALQKFDWYYLEDRWEYEIALQVLRTEDKVIEVGCGRGAFLRQAARRGIEVVGLELNNDAVEHCLDDGLSVYNKSLQDFSCARQEQYDCIVAFQVLEHIYDVKAFLGLCCSLLTATGTALFSVPNNQNLFFRGLSRFSYDEDCLLLNLPPHHTNRFDAKSLLRLGELCGFNVREIHFQPVWDARLELIARRYTRFFARASFRETMLRYFETVLRRHRARVKGDSLLIVFEKSNPQE